MTIINSIANRIRKYRVNRKYKDRLFRMIFQDKRDLLDLYNAINDTEYTDPDDLFITTLEDVVYLGMKNDLGFLIGWYLNLYEHQSTWNPNMPLRGFFYFADMLKGYIEMNDLNIYSSSQVMLPTPRYIIFYNGTRNQPDQIELRLSDSFMEQETEPVLECRATVLNINYGHNRELMQRCKILNEYAQFVYLVREYKAKGAATLEDAIDKAVDYCIEHDILAKILRKNRAEVKNMLLTIEDDKRHWRLLKKEISEQARAEGHALGRAEGRAEGHAEGHAEGRAEGHAEGHALGRVEGSILTTIRIYKQFGRSDEEICHVLMEEQRLTLEKAQAYLKEYSE